MRWVVFGSIVGACALGCSVDETRNPVELADDPPYVPPAETCTAPALDDPARFAVCNTGSGIFGTWVLDDRGRPAYDYGLDQNADERARFFNTESLDRRDHWHAFGNGRVNALVFNDGYVEVVTQDRGPTYLDAFDAAAGNFAGGYSYVDDGAGAWCSAYKWRPKGSHTRRRFGMGYAEMETAFRSVKLTRRLFAPPGDAPVVLDEVTLENALDRETVVTHYEVWDVARRPIENNWIVSGLPFTSVPEDARQARDARNALFDEGVTYDPDAQLLGLRRTHRAAKDIPSRHEPSPVDHYPGDPFLVALVGDVTDVFSDQDAFFGRGGVANPDALAGGVAGEGTAGGQHGDARSGLGQPRTFVLRSDLRLEAGEKKTLRFAYGFAPMGEPFAVDASWRSEERDFRGDVAGELDAHGFLFASEAAPALHRELAWHASQMEASVGRRDYFGVHVVPQGSAYLYLHGADGAARDLSLFAVPLVYTHPELAREELALNMMITWGEDHRTAYAFQGHGVLDDALGLHKGPTDLPIFLLWALSEYVGATGDTAFLDASMPYYPRAKSPKATVLDHARAALRYLFDVVGTGEHGLVRLGSGDWSDGIALEAKDHQLAVDEGESVPNTQMAATVLPRMADLLDARDPALATEIRERVAGYRAALSTAFTGEFFGRAYFGDGELAYADKVNLEAQVWALVGGTFADEEERANVVEAVRRELDEPSPAGATLLPKGPVWPAISALLTWGYARSDPELALRHLVKNTMAAHAVRFPEIWYGIWSGPDGLNGPAMERPGEAWYSPATPMTDFPAMNNNQHAMPLLAALRAAGVDATAHGIRIEPGLAVDFALRTALVDVSLRGSALSGVYRPIGTASRTIEVWAPSGKQITSLEVNGETRHAPGDARSVTLDAPGQAATAFRVAFR